MRIKLVFICFSAIVFLGSCDNKDVNELNPKEISLAVELSPKGIPQVGSSFYSYDVNGVILASQKVELSNYGFYFRPIKGGPIYLNLYGPATKIGPIKTTFYNMPKEGSDNEYNKTVFFIVLMNGDTITTNPEP